MSNLTEKNTKTLLSKTLFENLVDIETARQATTEAFDLKKCSLINLRKSDKTYGILNSL